MGIRIAAQVYIRVVGNMYSYGRSRDVRSLILREMEESPTSILVLDPAICIFDTIGSDFGLNVVYYNLADNSPIV